MIINLDSGLNVWNLNDAICCLAYFAIHVAGICHQV